MQGFVFFQKRCNIILLDSSEFPRYGTFQAGTGQVAHHTDQIMVHRRCSETETSSHPFLMRDCAKALCGLWGDGGEGTNPKHKMT